MRVLIYGGRNFPADRAEYLKALAFLNDLTINVFPRTEEDYLPDITVITGEAQGADQLGIDFAVVNWTCYEGYPALWSKHGKRAGFIRNQQMLDSGVDLAIEFPGGKGTADMRRRLDKAGVRVIEYPNKEVND